MSPCNLQNALCDLARVRITVRFGLGLRSESRLGLGLGLEIGSGLNQKFAKFAWTISKLCIAFCKLRRLTNRAQQFYGGLIQHMRRSQEDWGSVPLF